MNTQIQRGLAEIAKPPPSEWQVRAEGEGDFGPPAPCRHHSNHTGVERTSARTSAQLDLHRLRNLAMYMPPKMKSDPNRPKRDILVIVFSKNQERPKTRFLMLALGGQLRVVACMPPGTA